VTIVEGQDRIVTMTMRLSHVEPPVARPVATPSPPPPPSPPPQPSPWNTVGWVGVTVGAVGLVQGIVFGALTLDRESKLADACQDQRCPTSQQPAFDEAKTLAHLSTASFVLAGVGTAIGITGLVVGSNDTDDTPDQAARLSWTVGPTGVALSGAF
jgi:hypothetical protein